MAKIKFLEGDNLLPCKLDYMSAYELTHLSENPVGVLVKNLNFRTYFWGEAFAYDTTTGKDFCSVRNLMRAMEVNSVNDLEASLKDVDRVICYSVGTKSIFTVVYKNGMRVCAELSCN